MSWGLCRRPADRGPRQRSGHALKLIIAGAVFNPAMFIFFGLARTLPLMAAALFLLMLPLPANNALYKSILQVKVPADLGPGLCLFGAALSVGFDGVLSAHRAAG